MKHIWIIGLAGLLSLPVYAGKLYQWVDAEGNTQFSQTPPPEGTDASTKNIKAPDISAAPPKAEPAPKPEEKKTETAKTTTPTGDDPASKIKAEKEAKCQQATSVLQQLNAQGSLVIPKEGSPNEYVPMSDELRKQRTSEAQAFIDVYCKDSAATSAPAN